MISILMSCYKSNFDYLKEQIDLYGFDFGETITFYNYPNYVPLHNYKEEGNIVREYEKDGLLTIN